MRTASCSDLLGAWGIGDQVLTIQKPCLSQVIVWAEHLTQGELVYRLASSTEEAGCKGPAWTWMIAAKQKRKGKHREAELRDSLSPLMVVHKTENDWASDAEGQNHNPLVLVLGSWLSYCPRPSWIPVTFLALKNHLHPYNIQPFLRQFLSQSFFLATKKPNELRLINLASVLR